MSDLHEQSETRKRYISREYAAYQYTSALEAGDIDRLLVVLQEAVCDPVLERMILETHEVYKSEDHIVADAEEVKRVDDWLSAPLMLPLAPVEMNIHHVERPATRGQRLGTFARSLAAVLVVGALLSGFLVLFAAHSSRSGSGDTSSSVIAWGAFSPTIPGSDNDNLNSIADVSTDDMWTVGGYYTSTGEYSLFEHWDGSGWKFVYSRIPGYLYGVAAVSSNDVWAAGFTSRSSDKQTTQTLIEHWDGRQWKAVSSPNSELNFNVLYSVAAIATNDIWAVGASRNVYDGANTHPLIEHWDGKQWSLMTLSVYGGLTGISVVSANNVWAVGADLTGSTNGALIEHWNGQQWSTVAPPSLGADMGALYAVKANSANDIWAVGNMYSPGHTSTLTLIAHWDGSHWTAVRSLSPGHVQNGLFALAARSAHDVWAVGAYSDRSPGNNNNSVQTLVEHWNGHQWSVVQNSQILVVVQWIGSGIAGTAAQNPKMQYKNNNIWLSGIAIIPQSGTIWMVGFTYQGSRMVSRLLVFFVKG